MKYFFKKKMKLDSFDTSLYIEHNSLIWTPIEMIQDDIERKENIYNFYVLSFERFGLQQGKKWAAIWEQNTIFSVKPLFIIFFGETEF